MSRRLLNRLAPGTLDVNRLSVEAAAEVIRWRERLTGNLFEPPLPDGAKRIRVIWRIIDQSGETEYEDPKQTRYFSVLDRVQELRVTAGA